MKKFSFILTGIIIGALIVNIVIFLIGRSPAAFVANEDDSMKTKIESVMIKQFEFEHRSLVISNAISDSLQKRINNNLLFVLFFDSYSCDVCTSKAIADLIDYKEKIGVNNILVIVSEDDQRKAMLLMNKVSDHFNTLWVKRNELMIEGIREDNVPTHLFLLDSTMKPFCLYLYMPEFPLINKEYFNIITNRILQQ